MAFHFSLESLLRIRERMLELAETEFAQLINKKRELEKEYKRSKALLKGESEKLKQAIQEGIMSSEFNLRIQLIASMEQKVKELDGRLKQIEIELLKARENLKQRHTECELVRNLKERQLKKYLKEVDAKLQKELDELVSLKYARLRGAS